MHKSLDLIIPVYNSHDALVKALASVAVNDIDFKLKVYIVNDGSSKGYSEEAEIFKDLLDITILLIGALDMLESMDLNTLMEIMLHF